MIDLLMRGEVLLFLLILFTIIFSLTFHEFGHAFAAKSLGDDTAQLMGRYTLNPASHIDPMGLIMVVVIGFGYAKPVPFTPRKLRHKWGSAIVAFAGPFMNFLIALISINVLAWGVHNNIGFFQSDGVYTLLAFLAQINLLLMLFNLIPLGPLDGHYILPWFLPRDLAYKYNQFNAQYGSMVFLALIVLSIMGLPIFRFLMDLSRSLLGLITFL